MLMIGMGKNAMGSAVVPLNPFLEKEKIAAMTITTRQIEIRIKAAVSSFFLVANSKSVISERSFGM